MGFVKGRGTREQILNLRQIIEKSREYFTPVCISFVDYEKTFANLKWNELWRILGEMEVPKHLISVLNNLYDACHSVVKADNIISCTCKIRKEIRQGCILSPILFNAYSKYVMRYVLKDWPGGVLIGGQKMSNLRFDTNDTTLLAQNQCELETLIDRLEIISDRFGLRINYAKTKIMIVDRGNSNLPHLKTIPQCEVVSQFVYLGAIITNDGNCEPEIRHKIQLGRCAMTQLTKIWCDRSITRETKAMLVNILEHPVMTYASETWILRTADSRRVEAFEIWCWRRMFRIPWTNRRTNISIIKEVNPKQRLSTFIYKKILTFFGHINHSPHKKKLIVQDKPNGRRRRGHSPTRWIDLVKNLMDANIEQLSRDANNRDK